MVRQNKKENSRGIIVSLVLIVIGVVMAATLFGVFTQRGIKNPEVPPFADRVVEEAKKVQDLEPSSNESKEGTIDAKGRFVQNGCVVGGCSDHVCTDIENAPVATTCEYRASYACFQESFARCEKQNNGMCDWTSNNQLNQCLRDAENI